MGSKMGRPTDNRKGKSIHVRLDEQSDTILEIYTKQKKNTRPSDQRMYECSHKTKHLSRCCKYIIQLSMLDVNGFCNITVT